VLNPDCIAYRDDLHTYTHKPTGMILPSVSQIPGVLGGYEGISPAVLQYAADRGTAVHLAAQLHDEGDLDEATVDPLILPYLSAWILFRQDTGFKPTLREALVYHDALMFCGRFDMVGTFPSGDTALLDIKTQRIPTPDKWGMQLAAYAEAAKPDCAPKTRAVVHLLPDGNYRYYKLDGHIHWKRFKVCLDFFNLKRELEINGKTN
jgi:hypothetical protein